MSGLRRAKSRSRWNRAAALGRSVLELDPLNEEATLTVAEAKALVGSKAEAIAMLDRFTQQMDGKPGELKVQASTLRKRIVERLPAYRAEQDGPPIFIGREELMETIGTHVRSAKAGVGAVAALWGEPGIGKTRLLQELSAEATLDGWTALIVPCQPSWHDRPLATLEQMTSALLTQPGAAGIDPEALRTLKRLSRIEPDGEPLPDSPAQVEVLQAKLRMAVLDLVDAVSHERPVLIGFDDVQWMDAASTQLISMTIERSTASRVAMLFVARAQDELPLAVTGRSGSLAVRVPALGEPEMLRLLGALVQRHRAPELPHLLERAAEVANGNPLYAHTLVEHWTNTGNTTDLPPTLEVLIEQRLDRLDDTALQCLQIGALLGRNALAARIADVLGGSLGSLLAALESLHRLGLISSTAGTVEVRHGLIAKRCIARLPAPSSQLLHRAIARNLEGEARNGLDVRLSWDCANHWRLAGDSERARGVLTDSGEALVRLGLAIEAVEIFRHLVDSASDHMSRAKAMEAYHGALSSAGRWQDLATSRLAYLREQPESDLSDAELIASDIVLLEARSQVSAQYAPIIDAARSLARNRSKSVAHRARAAFVWLSRADNGDLVDEVRSAYSLATSLMAQCGDTVGGCLVQLIYDVSIGDVAQSAATAESIVALSATQASPALRARLLRSASLSFRLANKPSRALAVLEHAYSICEKHNLPQSAVSTLSLAGAVAIEEGLVSEANIARQRSAIWETQTEDDVCRLDALLLASRTELLSGRPGRGVALVKSYDWSQLDATTTRSQAFLLAVRVHIARMESDEAAIRQFGERLLHVLRGAWRTACVDYVVGAAVTVAVDLRGVDAAIALATEYVLSVRRQMGPPRGDLGRFVRAHAPHLNVE